MQVGKRLPAHTKVRDYLGQFVWLASSSQD